VRATGDADAEQLVPGIEDVVAMRGARHERFVHLLHAGSDTDVLGDDPPRQAGRRYLSAQSLVVEDAVGVTHPDAVAQRDRAGRAAVAETAQARAPTGPRHHAGYRARVAARGCCHGSEDHGDQR
jgi:hypothetical protein